MLFLVECPNTEHDRYWRKRSNAEAYASSIPGAEIVELNPPEPIVCEDDKALTKDENGDT